MKQHSHRMSLPHRSPAHPDEVEGSAGILASHLLLQHAVTLVNVFRDRFPAALGKDPPGNACASSTG